MNSNPSCYRRLSYYCNIDAANLSIRVNFNTLTRPACTNTRNFPVMSVFLCYEPEQRPAAEPLCEFGPAQANLDDYDARVKIAPDDDAAATVRQRVAAEIAAADVLVCLVGQTTFLSPWITWEIEQYLAKPNRNGMVCIILHKLYSPPIALKDAGTVYCNLKRDKVAMAIETAQSLDDLTDDYAIED